MFSPEGKRYNPQREQRQIRIIKWGGIVLLIFVLAVWLWNVTPDPTTTSSTIPEPTDIPVPTARAYPTSTVVSTSTSRPAPTTGLINRQMTATVQFLPRFIRVYNDNTFPWYGPIITLDDSYSTKYLLDDPYHPYLSKDKEILPDEEYGASQDAMVNERGVSYYDVYGSRFLSAVTLEAKSKIDGPYDLRAVFDFGSLDVDNLVIVNNGILLTNKPRQGTAPATPYALTEAPERRPTIEASNSEDFLEHIWIEHHEPHYDKAVEFVSKYPIGPFDDYKLPPDAFRELQAILDGVPYVPVDTPARCSLSPDCALGVSSSKLEQKYDDGVWDLEMVEGSGAGAGKRIYTVNHKADSSYYITWIEREGVGVQLVEMVAHLPDACEFELSGPFVLTNLSNLMQLVIPNLEPQVSQHMYATGCDLSPSHTKVDSVINGVVMQISYVDFGSGMLDITFWPCGTITEQGVCQWPRH